ncbi:MAG: hypothetical protein KDE27_20730 [Planctomycetes bacterium]|nr:hypothetical protein [Planctomycetota bacterium]
MMRNSFLLAVAATVVASQVAAQTWVEKTPFMGKPSARRAGAMVYDGNRILINGGTIASPGQILDETWTWNGTAWTLLAPANRGFPRWGHQMVHDTENSRVITFGGRSPTISGLSNDTWEWTGSTWSALSPLGTLPPARFRYGMVYDTVRQVVVLFGGRENLGNVDDTWEFDGAMWSEVTTANAPSPREDMVMAFDRATGTTVVFGGYDNNTATLLGDTWEYRGQDWLAVAPTTSPSPRYRAAAGYDTRRKRIVMYGGYDGTAFKTDTFEYTGADWQAIAVTAGTTNSTEMYYAFDEARNVLVTFGGAGTVFSDDHYEYTGTGTAIFGPFGAGCPHSTGTSTISGTPPVLGQALDMEVEDMPDLNAPNNFVLVANGFSSSMSQVGPLPFDLTPFGIVGCALEVEDGWISFVPESTVNPGRYTFGFTVPTSTSLQNLPYYVQAYIPDILAPNGRAGMSRPSRAIFGM